jgi:hypothetical protein
MMQHPVEFENMTDDEYHALWNDLGPIEIKMTEKHGMRKIDKKGNL